MKDNFIQKQYQSYNSVYQHSNGNQIFIGDVQAALDLDFINSQNIKTVVTAAKDMDHVTYNNNICHIVYPLLDGKNQNIANFFQQFYHLIQHKIHIGNILVHCAAGISRSSTLVISYIMKANKMNFKQAISLVRQSRPNVLPNLGFQRQLKKYQGLIKSQQLSHRNNIRGETKTAGETPLYIKTELLPNLEIKRKYIAHHHNNTIKERLAEKSLQVLKIYSVKIRKGTSFSRPVHRKDNGSEHQLNSINWMLKGSNTPFQKIRMAGIGKKWQGPRSVERGNTFYII